MKRFTRSVPVILDQAAASLSNLLVSVLVARAGSSAELGGFALGFVSYLVLQTISRSIVGDPFLIHIQGLDRRGVLSSQRGALSMSLGLAVAGGIVLVVSSWWVPESSASYFMHFGLFLPGLLVFDFLRYRMFALGHAWLACALDTSWLFLQIAGVSVAMIVWGNLSVSAAVASWILPPALISLTALAFLRLLPRPSAALAWWNEQAVRAKVFLGESILLTGVQASLVYIVGGVAGLAAAGSVRGAQTLLGPATLITGGANVFILPMLRQRAIGDRAKLVPLSLAAAAVMSSAVISTVFVIALIPDAVGEAILGSTWTASRPVAFLLAISVALNCVSFGATAGLRAIDQAGKSLRVRSATAPLAIGGIALGTVLGGATGGVAALALVSALQAVLWWGIYLRLAGR